MAVALALGAGACRGRPGGRAGYLAWGQPGRHRAGCFHRPRAVGATAAEVYVIDATGRVQVFTHDGAYCRGWALPEIANGTPTAVRETADGRVLIADTHYSRILEYSPEGELLRQWGSYGTGPEQFVYPTSIVLAPDGAYYISEYGMDAERVHVFDAERRFLREWGGLGEDEGQFSRAMALDVDAANTVYVCDTTNHRVQCFSPGGQLLRVIGGVGSEPGRIKFPYDICLAPDGSLVLCEYGNNRISRFDASGQFLGAFGGPGRGPGQFNAPRGAAVAPNGFIFVADTDNHRIQRFTLEDLV